MPDQTNQQKADLTPLLEMPAEPEDLVPRTWINDFAEAQSDFASEVTVFDGDKMHTKRTQICDDILDGIHAAGSLPKGKEDGMRYVGSVPLVLAQLWAMECGAAIGTAEFMVYAKRKLKDIDNRKLLVNRF